MSEKLYTEAQLRKTFLTGFGQALYDPIRCRPSEFIDTLTPHPTPALREAVEALKVAHERLLQLSYRVPDALWNEDWVAIQTTIPEALAALEPKV